MATPNLISSPPDDLIGPREAANLLGMTPRGLRHGPVQRGELPRYRIGAGGSYRYRRADVLALITRVTEPATER
jgi:hypothetical protein